MFKFTCRKFRSLIQAREDRELIEKEQRFIQGHVVRCQSCEQYEESSGLSLNMLRISALEAEPSPGFDDRLIRKVRLQTARADVRYWSPMFLSATVTALVVLAAVQLLTQSSNLPVYKANPRFTPEARRINVQGPLPNFFFSSDMRLK